MTEYNFFPVYSHEEELVTWRVPKEDFWAPDVLMRNIDSKGILRKDGEEKETACLKCKPAPCETCLKEELEQQIIEGAPNDKPDQVCPTRAITIGADGFPTINEGVCIHCQACILRCPVHALHWEGEEIEVEKDGSWFTEKRGTRKDAEKETKSWWGKLDKSEKIWEIEHEQIKREVSVFEEKVEEHCSDNEEFYTLVRTLLRGLDVKTNLGKRGDTQWRFDAITLDPFISPIEIKSPSEGKRPGPDSARQAVENIGIMKSRHGQTTTYGCVISYKLPSFRSDVQESIEDMRSAFGESVSVFPTSLLIYLNLCNLQYNFRSDIDIKALFRDIVGVCTKQKLRDFWGSYFQKRLEMIVLVKESGYWEKLADRPINNQSIENLDGKTTLDYWRKEMELVDWLYDEIIKIK